MKSILDFANLRYGPGAAIGLCLSLLNIDEMFPGVAAVVNDVATDPDYLTPVVLPQSVSGLPSSAYRAAMRGKSVPPSDQLAILFEYVALRESGAAIGLADFMEAVLLDLGDPEAPEEEAPFPVPPRPQPVELVPVTMTISLPRDRVDAALLEGAMRAVENPKVGGEVVSWEFRTLNERDIRVAIAWAEGGPYFDVSLWESPRPPWNDPGLLPIISAPPGYAAEGSYSLADEASGVLFELALTLHAYGDPVVTVSDVVCVEGAVRG